MKIIIALFLTVQTFAACPSLQWQSQDYEAFEAAQKSCQELESILCDLQGSRGETLPLRNQFIDLVMRKNSLCDDLTKIFAVYFLQKRLTRSDPMISKKLLHLHGILTLIGEVKESIEIVKLYALRSEITDYQYLLNNPKPFKKYLHKERCRRAHPRYTKFQ